MDTKILASLLTIGIASAGLGYGTFAWFSDFESSGTNLFNVGNLELRAGGLNGVTATIGSANFAPGDSVSGQIELTNPGTIFSGNTAGHQVELAVRLLTSVTDDVGAVDDPDDGGVSPNNALLHSYLTVTMFSYAGQQMGSAQGGGVGDVDGDGRANSLADYVAHGPFTGLADPGANGGVIALAITFHESAPNHLKRDVVDLTMEFFLAQQGTPLAWA